VVDPDAVEVDHGGGFVEQAEPEVPLQDLPRQHVGTDPEVVQVAEDVVAVLQPVEQSRFTRTPRAYPNRAPILRKDLLAALEQAAAGGVDLPETRWLVDHVDGI
jgi:hypothetical protein